MLRNSMYESKIPADENIFDDFFSEMMIEKESLKI